MPAEGLEPAIQASNGPHSHDLDRVRPLESAHLRPKIQK